MKAMKFRVESPEHSEKIQRALFALGYDWVHADKQTRYTNQKHLYAEKSGQLMYASDTDEEYFWQQEHTETTLEEILPLTEAVRPPLGLRPKYIVKQQRIQEILEAMQRYTEAGVLFDKVWLDELTELVTV